jgi:3-methyladenine DNA glycosylase/8-oxoguanine DNA glycosylase
MSSGGTAIVDQAQRKPKDVGARGRKRAPLADGKAREVLRTADPVLARLIDARPDFRPRAWMEELPTLDAFGTLIFQVAGQQLSVSATRTIVSRIEQHFGGHLPSPSELLAADPHVLRASGMSTRKGETLRALAERFVDGRLSDEALARMSDEEVESALIEVPGIGAMVGARVPARRARPARRLPHRRHRVTTCDSTRLRIRATSSPLNMKGELGDSRRLQRPQGT